jgi:hypothetical protein
VSPAPQIETAVLEIGSPDGCRLSLSLLPEAGRYQQRLVVRDGGQAREWLLSCEGDHDELWPASPPLQQHSLQSAGDGRRFVLLLGMAGNSHWSLSIEEQPAEAALLFDVACRLQRAPAWLGSCYASRLPIDFAGGAGRIRGSGAAMLFIEPLGEETVLRPGPGEASFSLAPWTNPERLAATIRWKYRMRLGTSR